MISSDFQIRPECPAGGEGTTASRPGGKRVKLSPMAMGSWARRARAHQKGLKIEAILARARGPLSPQGPFSKEFVLKAKPINSYIFDHMSINHTYSCTKLMMPCRTW